MPGSFGTIISSISNSAANQTACIEPAPPKATSENSLGSIPFLTVIVLIASAIFAFIIDKIPSANCDGVIESSFEIFKSEFSDSFTFNFIQPPSFDPEPNLPKKRFASVTVGSCPPLS